MFDETNLPGLVIVILLDKRLIQNPHKIINIVQQLLLLCVVACGASASPQRYQSGPSFSSGSFIPILRDERNGPINGVYDFLFETGNGIRRQEQGAPTAPKGAVESQGSWRYCLIARRFQNYVIFHE